MKNNVGVGVGVVVGVGVGVGVGVYVWEDVLEYVWEYVAMNDWNWRCSTSKLELHVHHKQAGCSFSLSSYHRGATVRCTHAQCLQSSPAY